MAPSLPQSWGEISAALALSHRLALATVPGYPATVQIGTESKTLVQHMICQAIRPADCWQAKPGPIPINPRLLPHLAGPVGSNLRFCISACTFMVACSYATDDRKILKLVHHGLFSMHWPFSWSKWPDTCTIPHAPYHILKMSINRVSTIVGHVFWVILEVTDYT